MKRNWKVVHQGDYKVYTPEKEVSVVVTLNLDYLHKFIGRALRNKSRRCHIGPLCFEIFPKGAAV